MKFSGNQSCSGGGNVQHFHHDIDLHNTSKLLDESDLDLLNLNFANKRNHAALDYDSKNLDPLTSDKV